MHLKEIGGALAQAAVRHAKHSHGRRGAHSSTSEYWL